MDALALLRLQVEWGADEALDADPRDRLRPLARPPAVAPESPTLRPPPSVPPQTAATAAPPPGSAADRAAAEAAGALTLDDLRAAIRGFEGCALRTTATNPVLPAGIAGAPVLLIGEPPGIEEDRSGTPFAGVEGALLDKMLASIGLNRTGLLLAPLIPWRPPGGRPPTPGEISVCLPFLHRLVVLAAPRRLVILGGVAASALQPRQTRRRGPPAWSDCLIPGLAQPVPAIALPAPGMLLRTPSQRRDAWAGLRLLRRALDQF